MIDHLYTDMEWCSSWWWWMLVLWTAYPLYWFINGDERNQKKKTFAKFYVLYFASTEIRSLVVSSFFLNRFWIVIILLQFYEYVIGDFSISLPLGFYSFIVSFCRRIVLVWYTFNTQSLIIAHNHKGKHASLLQSQLKISFFFLPPFFFLFRRKASLTFTSFILWITHTLCFSYLFQTRSLVFFLSSCFLFLFCIAWNSNFY